MSEEVVERTLCQIPHVFVFKIPARQSAEGHRAADWPKDPSWTGKLKIVARGSVAAIILQDERNQVFAVCQVTDDSSVEKTLDSGRYFVLKITNQQGRHAFIGIAFNERNDAFDFNVALNEFKQEIERESKASLLSQSAPSQDFSLKSGEKVKIKLGLKKSQTNDGAAHAQSEPTPSPAFTPQLKPIGRPDQKPAHSKDLWGSDPWGADPWGADPFASAPSSGNAQQQKAPTTQTKELNIFDL